MSRTRLGLAAVLACSAVGLVGCGSQRPWQPEPSAKCLRDLPSLAGAVVSVPKLTQKFRDVAFGKGRFSKTETLTVSTTTSHRALWLTAFFAPQVALGKPLRDSLVKGAPKILVPHASLSRNVVIVWRRPPTRSVEQDVLSCLQS
jgi:hypothetical protein